MKTEEWIKTLSQWDQEIQSGRASVVKKEISKTNIKKVPRTLLLSFCQMARRVGRPELILLWLNPIVRPQKILQENASPQEQAIYALALLRLGAFNEATKLLQDLDPRQDPQIYFYKASLHINQWNYGKAVPELRRYIKATPKKSYEQLVGLLNLCSCLVSLRRWSSAELEIQRLYKKLKRQDLPLLTGNLLEIRSQMHLSQNQYDNSLKDIQLAQKYLSSESGRAHLYVHKWEKIIQLRRNKNKVTNDYFDKIKEVAQNIQDWETLRDCDFQLALHNQDAVGLEHLYWSSFFPNYKKRVIQSMSSSLVLKDSYIWYHHSFEKSTVEKPVDLVLLTTSPCLRKLFQLLLSEHYRPLRVTEIFATVYPDEYYNPLSSPAKIKRLIQRGRILLKQKNLDMEIANWDQSYKLKASPKYPLVIHKNLPEVIKNDVPDRFLKLSHFTCQDWAKYFSISLRTARRQLQDLIKVHKIVGVYKSSRTYYYCI